ncbi:unnamed protein product [Urochloa humidicola]
MAASARRQPPAAELACAGGGGAWPAAVELSPWRRPAAAASFLSGNGRQRGSLQLSARVWSMEAGVSHGEASAGGAGGEEARQGHVGEAGDADGELGVLHALRRAARGSAFPSLFSGGGEGGVALGGGSSSSSTPDLALELSVLVHGDGGGRIRSSSLLSVEGPAGVKQGGTAAASRPRALATAAAGGGTGR